MLKNVFSRFLARNSIPRKLNNGEAYSVDANVIFKCKNNKWYAIRAYSEYKDIFM
jgi:hypothetical protein